MSQPPRPLRQNRYGAQQNYVAWMTRVSEMLERHHRTLDDFSPKFWQSLFANAFTADEAARQALEARMSANGTYRDRWATNVPAKDWRVLRIVDYGPGEYYRYGVEGENLNFLPEDIDYKFRWRVRDLDDVRYDLSRAVKRLRYAPNPRNDDDDFDIDEEAWRERDDRYDDDGDDRSEFADPGGRSALRAGERTERCPSCGGRNRLTVRDRQLGYQCDACAHADEHGGERPDNWDDDDDGTDDEDET